MNLCEKHFREYMKLSSAGNYEDARSALRDALNSKELDTDVAELYLAMVSTYIDEGDVRNEEVCQCFNQAEQGDATHYSSLARARYYRDVLNDSELYLRQLLKARARIKYSSDGVDPEDDARICQELDQEIADVREDRQLDEE